MDNIHLLEEEGFNYDDQLEKMKRSDDFIELNININNLELLSVQHEFSLIFRDKSTNKKYEWEIFEHPDPEHDEWGVFIEYEEIKFSNKIKFANRKN